MDIKKFVLSYYNNAAENYHIQKVEKTREAKKPVAAILEASSWFCLPSSREMKFPLP